MANRITQAPAEVAVIPSSQKGRTTQVVAEVAVIPTTQQLRATQLVVEVALTATVTGPGPRSWGTVVG